MRKEVHIGQLIGKVSISGFPTLSLGGVQQSEKSLKPLKDNYLRESEELISHFLKFAIETIEQTFRSEQFSTQERPAEQQAKEDVLVIRIDVVLNEIKIDLVP